LPLFFELAIEVTYGLIPEASAGAILTLMNNIGSAVFLVIPTSAHGIMNVIMTLEVTLALTIVIFVKERYRRYELAESRGHS
jgi:hypothetical protein